ncbi:GNAT family N-acetyltransferase [Actinomadura kijaniata]|uniref:GNAT family N-acetyltransferase n=1 Tax=Actinomadura kijaniata TaxID=46161 RepID=UPI003F1C0F00
MDVEITAGTVDDVAGLETLWLAMLDHHREVTGERWPMRGPGDSWDLCAGQYRTWLGEGSALLFLARPTAPEGGTREPVGYLLCQLLPSGPTFDLGPSHGEVHSLAVSGRARGGGIGSALLRACKRELRARGVTHWSIGVLEDNRDAVRLYERLGFSPWTRHLLARLDE